MILTALLAVLPMQEAGSVELYRGAPLANQAIRYWDVSDTYLDSQKADTTFGGEGVLQGGPGRTVLLRFGDLRRAVGDAKIVKASIVLTPSGGEVPSLRSVSRLLAPWGEGPVMTLAALLERNARAPGKDKKDAEKEIASRWAATWKAKRAGVEGLTWQQPGATGSADSVRIDGVKLVPAEQMVTITGLESAVQAMVDRPFDNQGFALTFSNPCEFFSTQSPFGRPKLVLEYAAKPKASGPDLAVLAIERVGAATDGQEVSYVAKIRNVGTEPSKGFAASWVIGEREGSALDVPASLAPGAETTLSIKRTYRFDPADHRLQPVALKITPTGPDALAANNALEVQESARTIEVVADPAMTEAIQNQVRLFNEVIAPQSRFSFAREGALERVAVQRVVGTPSAGSDAKLEWTSGIEAGADIAFLRALGKAVGLPDMTQTQFKPGEKNKLNARGSADLFPGIMGYGDTRFEGTLLGSIALLYEPHWSAVFDVQPLEATGLLASTDVRILNQGLARQSSAEAVLAAIPDTVLLRATDLMGRPLAGMELSFFQSKGGAFADDAPVFSVATDARGGAVLPRREGGLFGKPEPGGGNGVFLVSASSNGVTEWGWLKSWQLVDSVSRTGPGAAVFDMRFDLPTSPVDSSTDLALDRIATDSQGSPPAKLAGLVDGKADTEIDLGSKKGDWIEIDLGRDRTLAEIDVLGANLWPKFEVQVYSTGQRPAEATIWGREQSWAWASANRRDLVGTTPLVAYRGQPLRVRFIRLVNKSDQGGKIAGLRVLAAKL